MNETTAKTITVKEAVPKTNANGSYAIVTDQDAVKYYCFPPKNSTPAQRQAFLQALATGNQAIIHWYQSGNFKHVASVEPLKSAPVVTPAPVVVTPPTPPAPVPNAPQAIQGAVVAKPIQVATPASEPHYNGKTSAEWDEKERRERGSIEAQAAYKGLIELIIYDKLEGAAALAVIAWGLDKMGIKVAAIVPPKKAKA